MLPGYTNQHLEPASSQDERFTFIAEWYDDHAALIRKYQFLFYPIDNSIAMHDIKLRRRFLTRTKVSSITRDDLYVGNQINICSRQLTLTDYADAYTKRHLVNKNERSFALIKPESVNALGVVLKLLSNNDLIVYKGKMVQLTRKNAAQFYVDRTGETIFSSLIKELCEGPVIVMEVRGENAICKWKKLIGPDDVKEAKEKNPTSLIAKYGIDNVRNGFYGCNTPEEVAKDLEFFYPTKGDFRLIPATKYENSTLCIIKPHAVRAGLAGDIVCAIQDGGFSISDFFMIKLEKVNAEEFYDIYKGVLMEYTSMVKELFSGPLIALEIHTKSDDTACQFRDFCGPADPEVARNIRPKTLRAMFGKDKIENAVHCTDLVEDAFLEIEYFFRILACK